jgi:hypothetical protein
LELLNRSGLTSHQSQNLLERLGGIIEMGGMISGQIGREQHGIPVLHEPRNLILMIGWDFHQDSERGEILTTTLCHILSQVLEDNPCEQVHLLLLLHHSISREHGARTRARKEFDHSVHRRLCRVIGREVQT